MSEKYSPKKGDRVRVVLEGEVTDTAGGSVTISDRALRGSDPDSWCSSTVADDAKFLVSVEKIEPPVETFKPGDVVRHKAIPKYVYALGDDGYVNLYIGCVYKYGEPRAAHVAGDFTSRDYEKVNLG